MENEENKKANHLNNPNPLYPLQKSCVHCVDNMYFCVLNVFKASEIAGSGKKKIVFEICECLRWFHVKPSYPTILFLYQILSNPYKFTYMHAHCLKNCIKEFL